MIDLFGQVEQVADALDEANLEFAFGGALALLHYTVDPRATADIDVCIFVEDADVARQALTYAEWPPGSSERLTNEGWCRVLWDGTYLDVFLIVHEFHNRMRTRVQSYRLRPEGRWLPFVGANDLAVLKAMFDRSKDWVDIESMLEADAVNVRSVADELNLILGEGDSRVPRLLALEE